TRFSRDWSSDVCSSDLTREPGWLGGVAAGLAARLGIDPILVRGILVVVALIGAPALLLYAAAWLLLPDLEGRIHLERLTRGHFEIGRASCRERGETSEV